MMNFFHDILKLKEYNFDCSFYAEKSDHIIESNSAKKEF